MLGTHLSGMEWFWGLGSSTHTIKTLELSLFTLQTRNDGVGDASGRHQPGPWEPVLMTATAMEVNSSFDWLGNEGIGALSK